MSCSGIKDEPLRRPHGFPQPGHMLSGVAFNTWVYLMAWGALLIETRVSSAWQAAFPSFPTVYKPGSPALVLVCVTEAPIFSAHRTTSLHSNSWNSPSPIASLRLVLGRSSLLVWGESRLLFEGETAPVFYKPHVGLPSNTVPWNPVPVPRIWGQLRQLAI